jgi:hypothetical protein
MQWNGNIYLSQSDGQYRKGKVWRLRLVESSRSFAALRKTAKAKRGHLWRMIFLEV